MWLYSFCCQFPSRFCLLCYIYVLKTIIFSELQSFCATKPTFRKKGNKNCAFKTTTTHVCVCWQTEITSFVWLCSFSLKKTFSKYCQKCLSNKVLHFLRKIRCCRPPGRRLTLRRSNVQILIVESNLLRMRRRRDGFSKRGK